MAGEAPLRIIHCFRSPIGGIFRHVRDLAEAHARDGHQVGILCDSSTGGQFEEALFDEIRPHLALGLVRLPIRRSVSPSDLAALWRSYSEIRALKPDVLHGHGAKGGAVARLIGTVLKLGGQKVVRIYSPHGGSLHYDRSSLAGRGVFFLERFQERLTDSIVFVCDYERSVYDAKVGVPRTASKRIYNGIDDRDFERVEPSPGAVDFLYIGMLRDLKGPDVFIEAFLQAERIIGRPLSAMMVGDGPQKAKYEAMIIERGLGRRIDMMPAMKARAAFAFARTVVVPSRAEAMPYIVLEALAAERPVIASRVGGIPEILGPNNIALSEPDNAAALASIMADAIRVEGWAARAVPPAGPFRASFATSAMANSMMDLYRGLLQRRM